MTTLRPGPEAGSATAEVPTQRHLGPFPITPISVVVALVLLGSFVFIGYVTISVHDNQIPLLAMGFVAFGAGWAAVAVGALVSMWRAASYARQGRATLLALAGGICGLGAIGCFAIAALLTLVWNT
jgi:hypothetical protein